MRLAEPPRPAEQSDGSTPKALANYGIKEGAWCNEEEMFALMHQMRARIITSHSFNGDRILTKIPSLPAH